MDLTVIVAAGHEAERFNAAFYRFLELHMAAAESAAEACRLTTLPGAGVETKVIRLWSQEACFLFTLFWNSFPT